MRVFLARQEFSAACNHISDVFKAPSWTAVLDVELHSSMWLSRLQYYAKGVLYALAPAEPFTATHCKGTPI